MVISITTLMAISMTTSKQMSSSRTSVAAYADDVVEQLLELRALGLLAQLGLELGDFIEELELCL